MRTQAVGEWASVGEEEEGGGDKCRERMFHFSSVQQKGPGFFFLFPLSHTTTFLGPKHEAEMEHF